MFENINDMNYVSNIVNLSNLVNYKVCAEGVETKEQYEKMKTIGVDYMQGYYFAKPMSSERFIQLLNDNQKQRNTSEQ